MSNYNEKKILIYVFSFVIHVVCAEKHDYIEVNYDIGEYKILHVNETLELICKNKINTSPPSWHYHKRLHNDPRMKVSADGNQSRMVISNAQAEDAGKYRCEIEHEYEGKTHHFSKMIEVVVNEIYKVEQEETEDGIKLLCDVKAYPSSHVSWKIDYANEALNPPSEAPDPDDEYWIPTDPRVLVDQSNGRFTLRPYKGVNNAELLIVNVTANDNGKYYCVARNLLGEQCKDCTVNRTKRGVEGEVKSITSGGNEKTKNSQEGLAAGIIALIVLASVVPVCGVLGALLALSRVHFINKKSQPKDTQKRNRKAQHALPLMGCNEVSVKI